MKRAAVLSFCLLSAALLPALAERGEQPVSQAEPAQITIDPLPAGRRLVQLPGVEFRLRLAPACPDDLAFQSLVVSIADTRQAFDVTDFETAAEIETSLRVPGRQISPIAVDQFCIADSESSLTAVKISDAFTANVSTRCGSESRQAITFDALALEVLLVCRIPGGTAAADSATPAADDPAETEAQDASAATVRF